MGFTRCMSDTCMYTNNINGNDVYIAIYVDDIIIACVDEATIIGIKQQISEKYTIKDMGVMDWYLGMRYTRDPKTGIITLDQSKYTEDILVKFQKLYRKRPYSNTPMEENLKLPKWTEEYEKTLSVKGKHPNIK